MAARLGPERTVWYRLRRRIETFLESGSLSYERNYLFVRPAIAGGVILAVVLQGGLPGGLGVIIACLCAIAYNFVLAYFCWREQLAAVRTISLLFDNLTVISASLWVFYHMGAQGYESDLWLIYISLIVSSSLYYGPIGSLFFTTLWTSLFVGVSLGFYESGTHFREQLPLRLVFFVLTGFVGISLAAELRKRRENLQAKTRQSLSMLAQVVEARDPFSGMHLKHIQHYSRALALRLGLDEAEADEVAYAAMIHDVGKAQIADAILKKNGPLTLEERQQMQLHTELSDVILADEEDFKTARDVARWHHERWDGTGYPEGLAGEQIPFAARIVAVADVYDALVSRRSYKEPWPPADAIMEIRRQSGAQFDPQVVEAFVELYATNVLRDLDLEMNRKADDDAAAALERPTAQAA